MALIEKYESLFVDSAYGQNVSALGSQFEYQLDKGLVIPSNAVSCEVSVLSANIWYNTPNLSAEATDQFVFSFAGTEHTYNIPSGLYDVSAVETMMNTAAYSAGISTSKDLFSLQAYEATGKIAIGVWIEDGASPVTIDFSQSTTLAALLGYAETVLTFPATTTDVYLYQLAPNVATFGSLSYYLIKSTLISSGIDPTGAASNVLCSITPNVSIGSQIVFEPYNPLVLQADALRGSTIQSIVFSLTDNLGNRVNTQGETWSLRIQIKYVVRV